MVEVVIRAVGCGFEINSSVPPVIGTMMRQPCLLLPSLIPAAIITFASHMCSVWNIRSVALLLSATEKAQSHGPESPVASQLLEESRLDRMATRWPEAEQTSRTWDLLCHGSYLALLLR